LFEETPRENWKLRKRAFLSIKSPGVRFQFSLEAIGSMSSEIETPGKRRVKNDGDILKLEPVLVRI